jgi:hypothetical protein
MTFRMSMDGQGTLFATYRKIILHLARHILMEQNNHLHTIHIRKLELLILTGMVFLGALLLFGMEPLVGRLLMPFLGGAAHVWLTCLMFFQAMLFIGYLYAHLFAKRLGIWHLLLLTLPLMNLPFQINVSPDPSAPIFNILAILLYHVALPFTVLSTTAVVAQSWFTDSSLGQDYEPYPLYAASNAGSLIALLGYTFVVEPLLGLKMQSFVWAVLYVAYIFIAAAAWFIVRPNQDRYHISASGGKAVLSKEMISRSTYLKWLLLSCLPSALLLSVTNFITLEIGSFPLMWIAPLALYLGSFVITFRKNGGAPKFFKTHWPEFLLLSFLYYLVGPQSWLALIGNVTILFIICLLAHGTLYEERPPSSYLTNFYLTSALGGWLGGAFISLAAPLIFKGLYDYPLLLILCAVTFWWCHDKSFITFWSKVSLSERVLRVSIIGILCILIGGFGWRSLKENTIFRYRNFYGTYRIADIIPYGEYSDGLRILHHGGTAHGSQLLNPDLRMIPTMYYHVGSGVSDVFETTPPPHKIGIIGLGSGCIAAYAKPEDMITYFEIDPDNERIAREWFTYLDDCRGKVDIVAGDGRLSILKNKGNADLYDIIIVDAFTGDGIPTHLLTKEAIEVYLHRLSPRGLLVFHISNRYYDLQPVLKSISAELNLSGAMNVSYNTNLKVYQNRALYIALTKDSEPLESLLDRGWKLFGEDDGSKYISPWTDDHINILASLKLTSTWSDDLKKLSAFIKDLIPANRNKID